METITHNEGFVSHDLGLLNDKQRADLFYYLELYDFVEIGVIRNTEGLRDSNKTISDKIVMVKLKEGSMPNTTEVEFRLNMCRVVDTIYK